jgi:hypothetical protein
MKLLFIISDHSFFEHLALISTIESGLGEQMYNPFFETYFCYCMLQG